MKAVCSNCVLKLHCWRPDGSPMAFGICRAIEALEKVTKETPARPDYCTIVLDGCKAKRGIDKLLVEIEPDGAEGEGGAGMTATITINGRAIKLGPGEWVAPIRITRRAKAITTRGSRHLTPMLRAEAPARKRRGGDRKSTSCLAGSGAGGSPSSPRPARMGIGAEAGPFPAAAPTSFAEGRE